MRHCDAVLAFSRYLICAICSRPLSHRISPPSIIIQQANATIWADCCDAPLLAFHRREQEDRLANSEHSRCIRWVIV